jgi:hypothetical protein
VLCLTGFVVIFIFNLTIEDLRLNVHHILGVVYSKRCVRGGWEAIIVAVGPCLLVFCLHVHLHVCLPQHVFLLCDLCLFLWLDFRLSAQTFLTCIQYTRETRAELCPAGGIGPITAPNSATSILQCFVCDATGILICTVKESPLLRRLRYRCRAVNAVLRFPHGSARFWSLLVWFWRFSH